MNLNLKYKIKDRIAFYSFFWKTPTYKVRYYLKSHLLNLILFYSVLGLSKYNYNLKITLVFVKKINDIGFKNEDL